MTKWYIDNYLKSNYDEYSPMLMSSRKANNTEININIDGENIESKPVLGLLDRVTLDNRLNYSVHISDVCRKAGKKVGVLTRLS